MKIKQIFYQLLWGVTAIVLLSGCGVKGLGQGLGDLFKNIHIP